jgi:hypothetical protein
MSIEATSNSYNGTIPDLKSNLVSDNSIETKMQAPVSEKKEKVVYVDEAYVWIINDGLLRDEGVIFGLSGANPADKIEAIKSYYEEVKASHESFQTFYEEKIGASEKELEDNRSRMKLLEEQGRNMIVPKSTVEGNTILRYIVGLALMIIAVYGSYYIIEYYIAPIYGTLATLGIFFFAIFSQMVPISSWVRPNDGTVVEPGNKQKRIAEFLLELGPPFSATLLTGYLIYKQSNDIALCIFLSFFLFFLLFFSGKLILGISQTVFQQTNKLKAVLKERRKVKSTLKKNGEEVSDLLQKVQNISIEISGYDEKKRAAIAAIEELTEKSLHKVKLFMSEYELAIHFSNTIKNNKNEQ